LRVRIGIDFKINVPLIVSYKGLKGWVMKAEIDRDGCIACEQCVATCPEVFRMAEDGLAEVYVDEVPEEFEEAAQEAADNCPTSVIMVE
jgi:ferredoxin